MKKKNFLSISKALKRICAALLSLAVLTSPVVSYAAPTQAETIAKQAADAEISRLGTAVSNKDINVILDYYMGITGNYYLTHGLEADFPFFNAKKYLAKYPDLTAAFGTDEKKALEHYVTFGYKEARESCGTYDIPLYLRNNPAEILNAELLKNVSSPEAYFLKLSEMTKTFQDRWKTKGPGTGASSGSGSFFYPVSNTEGSESSSGREEESGKKEEEADPGTVTVIFYIAGDNLESDYGDMTTGLLDAMLGVSGCENVNIIMALGGASTWHSDYLNGLLSGNRNGIFAIDNGELEKAVSKISAKYGNLSAEQLFTLVHKEAGAELKKELVGKLFNAAVMPVLQELSTTLEQQASMDELLHLAATEYRGDDYVLFFNGHGGGAKGSMDSLSVPDIRSALDKAGFGTSLPKLAMLAMDGCLMGSIEVGTCLSSYYTYMYASEVTAYGDLEYYSVLKTICDHKDDDAFAEELAYRIFANRISYGRDGTLLTAVIFDSSRAAETEKAVDDVAAALLAKVQSESEEADDIMKSIKAAGIKCCQVTGGTDKFSGDGYVDAADFLSVLKKELNDYHTPITEFNSLIDTAIQKLDDFSRFNGFNFDKTVMYESDEGQIIVPLNDFWKKYMEYDLGTALGSSTLTVPCGSELFVNIDSYTDADGNFEEGKEAEFRAAMQTCKDDFVQNYISRYGETGLSHYCDLMIAYIDYFLNEEEMRRISRLSKSMMKGTETDRNGQTNDQVLTYEELVDVRLSEDASLLQVKVNYSGVSAENVSDWTSGDLYVDLMDTVMALKVYITRKISAVYNEEKEGEGKQTSNVSLDMIIGEKEVSYQRLNGVNDSINILTKELLDIYVYYPGYDEDTTDENYAVSNYSDILRTSDLENDQERKVDLLLSFDEDYKALLNQEAETEEEIADKEQKLKEYRNKFIEAGIPGNYALYRGSCKQGEETESRTVELLFKKNADDDMVYTAAIAVEEQTEGEGENQKTTVTYTAVENVSSVSFYHYYLRESDDYYMDSPVTMEEKSEKSYGEDETKKKLTYYYTDIASPGATVGQSYSVGENTSLFVRYWKLSEMDGDASHYGYEVTAEGQSFTRICLNDDNKAACDEENYQGLFNNQTTQENIDKAYEEKNAEEKAEEKEEIAEAGAEKAAEEETEAGAEKAEKTEEIAEAGAEKAAEAAESETAELPEAESETEELSRELPEELPETLCETLPGEREAEGLLPEVA